MCIVHCSSEMKGCRPLSGLAFKQVLLVMIYVSNRGWGGGKGGRCKVFSRLMKEQVCSAVQCSASPVQ